MVFQNAEICYPFNYGGRVRDDEVKVALFVQGMVEFLVPAEKLSGIRVLEDNAGAFA